VKGGEDRWNIAGVESSVHFSNQVLVVFHNKKAA
jgi:hypothetical protein